MLLYQRQRLGAGDHEAPGEDPEGGGSQHLAEGSAGPSAQGTDGETPTIGQRRADAIGLLAEAALGSGLADDADLDPRADRYQVVVHVDQSVLEDAESPGASEIEGTGDVPAETSRRLACDASTVTMTHDQTGGILDVGRKTRVISTALRRALRHRDKTCRFPGCDLTHCDAHHIHHWAAGGHTKLENLVLMCRFHHRCVHEEGYRVETDSEGALVFRQPDGRIIREAPTARKLADDPSERLSRHLADGGVGHDALDHYPKWDGRRLDLGRAIEDLWSAR